MNLKLMSKSFYFQLCCCLQAAELIVWVTGVWMDVVKLFQIAAFVFCVPIWKKLWKDFQNFALKIFGKFFKF